MMRSTALDPAVLRPGARRPLPLLYRLFRAPVRRLLERVFDLAVDGLEYLPRSGPYIVAANHHNYLDRVVLGAAERAPRPLRAAASLPPGRRARPADDPAERDPADHGRHRRAAHVKPRPGRKNVRKPWAGRFTQSADPTAERFTGSLAFDRRLWPWDITGSVAWAKALGRAGLLTASERDTIVRGLDAVREELTPGTVPFRPELEDIHM